MGTLSGWWFENEDVDRERLKVALDEGGED